MTLSYTISNTIRKGISTLGSVLHQARFGGTVGTYRFEATGPRSARLVLDNPYPCDSYEAIITAMVQRFTPTGATPTIQHHNTSPSRSRHGFACTYTVTW